MKGTMAAVGIAGVLVASAAFAGTVQVGELLHSDAFVPVQYYERNDRWGDRSAQINEREARINARIQHGLSDGRITDREARRLYRELGDIEAKERAFASDGRLSGYERDELNRDLDRLADHVRDQIRDEQRRY
jgi:hypothetical protein